MNIDDLFDKMEDNPLKFLVGMWVVGGLVSLIGLALAILVIVGLLNMLGVV